jgi:hypothetical protein
MHGLFLIVVHDLILRVFEGTSNGVPPNAQARQQGEVW